MLYMGSIVTARASPLCPVSGHPVGFKADNSER